MALPDPWAPASLLLLLLPTQLAGLAAASSIVPGNLGTHVPPHPLRLTHMPNQFNHDMQDKMGLEVHQF